VRRRDGSSNRRFQDSPLGVVIFGQPITFGHFPSAKNWSSKSSAGTDGLVRGALPPSPIYISGKIDCRPGQLQPLY